MSVGKASGVRAGAATTTVTSRPKMNLLAQIQKGAQLKTTDKGTSANSSNSSSSSSSSSSSRSSSGKDAGKSGRSSGANGGKPKLDFLSQIKQGKKLKRKSVKQKKPPPRVKGGAPRMDLFAQIKMGSSKLKKVDHEKLKKEKAEAPKDGGGGGGGIMDALRMAVNKNRSAIAGRNCSDSEDSDDDEYWSD